LIKIDIFIKKPEILKNSENELKAKVVIFELVFWFLGLFLKFDE